MTDEITLKVNGQIYQGWTEMRVMRGIEHCAASFDISVSERWAGQKQPWAIERFNEVVVSIGGDPVITGYVDHYEPSYDAHSHRVRVAGRSKTADLVDCMPAVKGSQFAGYTVDRVARTLAGQFGVNVLAKGKMGAKLPYCCYEKTETAYAFLEKLCRLRSLLAFDDENGNLVLDNAGSSSASGALVEGENILAASARLTADHRFRNYAVLSQTPLSWDSVNTSLHVIGTATDPECPRPRRYAEMAEDPNDTATSAKRAKWRALHNYGKSTEATVTVQGWRQADGSLWKVNQLVPVKSPFLEIDRTLLIGKVNFMLDSSAGRRTELTVSPQEAFTPDPSVKFKKNGGTGASWMNAVKIKSP